MNTFGGEHISVLVTAGMYIRLLSLEAVTTTFVAAGDGALKSRIESPGIRTYRYRGQRHTSSRCWCSQRPVDDHYTPPPPTGVFC